VNEERETGGWEDPTAPEGETGNSQADGYAEAGEAGEETSSEGHEGSEGSSEGTEEGSGGRHWNPWNSFSEFQDTVSDIVDSALKNVGPMASGRYPRYDLIEVPDEGYWILMDLPGLHRDDLEVTTVGDELTVSGQRARPELPDGAEVRRSERGFGRFRRSIRMPADVDVSKVGAKLENGVLRLTLPRRTDSEGHRVEID
jgi:HSP20 family protein